MEYWYVFAFAIVFFGLIIGGTILKRMANRKAAEIGQKRVAKRNEQQREAFHYAMVKVNDAITVGLTLDQVTEVLTKTKVLKARSDGRWEQESAFSKQHPFTVSLQESGDKTRVTVDQYLSKNGVIDGDIYWSVLAERFSSAAKKAGASFEYHRVQYQSEELDKGVTRNFVAE